MTTLAELLATRWAGAEAEHPPPLRPTSPLDERSVVLVGRGADQHLDAVEAELRRRGEPSFRVAVDAPRPVAAQRPVDDHAGTRCRSALVRETGATRPLAHHNDRTVRSAHDHPERIRPFTARENEAAVLGWLAGLETDTWINDPWALPRAELKIEQLRVARRAGLRTPPTVVTGDADAVRTLADAAPDGIIYKSLSDPLVWIGDDAGFLYSTQLGPEHLGELEGLLRHVGLFQARIRARSELRVTVVGEMTFSVRVRAPDLDQVDWRRGLDRRQLRYEVIVLDDDLHRRILATVGALGLTYAAVDLIEDDAGWVFLEVNPAGAYRWLETGLDLPITPAICDLLLAT